MWNHQTWENKQEEVQLLFTHGKTVVREYIFVSLGHHICLGMCIKPQWAHIIYSLGKQILTGL